MDLTDTRETPWPLIWRDHAQQYPLATLGFGLTSGPAVAYPLGLAAGAMIFVVSHAVIPETHRNGHQTLATVGLKPDSRR